MYLIKLVSETLIFVNLHIISLWDSVNTLEPLLEGGTFAQVPLLQNKRYRRS